MLHHVINPMEGALENQSKVTQMSGDYQPSPDAATQPPWDTAFLSQRDAAFEIPVDFITMPGVSLRAACFGSNQFEDEAARLCISNLLSMGFKRLIVDLYWDAGRATWSLCPAEIPETASTEDETSIASAPSSRSTAVIASGVITDRQDRSPVQTEVPEFRVWARQDVSSAAISPSVISFFESSGTANVVTSPSPLASPIFDTGDESPIQIGPYQCTGTTGFSLLTDVLLGYFQASETTTLVDLILLDLKIHAAASSSDPNGPAQAPQDSELPVGTQLLSGTLNANLSTYIYTPPMLYADRANLNNSWFEIPGPDGPIIPYLTIIKEGETYSTPSGWPTETFTNFQRYSRLIVSVDTVDPQMSNYNYTGDADTIFMAGTIEALRNVTFSSNGTVQSGCFFDRSIPSVTEATNNSWAASADLNIPQNGIPADNAYSAISNLSSCGISPLLNTTLGGQSADTNPFAYRDFANAATIWSWASGQPNTTDSNQENDDDENPGFLCAAFYPALNGRWKATDCQQRHYAACRIGDQPYTWTLSEEQNVFTDLDSLCPDNSAFSLPRTGLENSWLLVAVQEAYARMGAKDPSEPVFVNFQALDRDDCWVNGVNQTCPYEQDPHDIRTRTVVVPAAGAVIIFAVAAFMFFIKCASNRQNARRGRRRRGGDRGDYEGVPS